MESTTCDQRHATRGNDAHGPIPHLQAQKTKMVATGTVPRRSTRLTSGDPQIRFRNSRIISQEVINMLLMDDLQNNTVPFLKKSSIGGKQYLDYL
jgi:hypothetical protein